MNRKRRILFVGECSFLATGFSTYWNEVISRLHKTGEFEIAELGSYASPEDPRCDFVPWKLYPVIPANNDIEYQNKYNSCVTAQFGELMFDRVCLEWQPDIVCAIRDWWMDEFIERSPYRKYFSLLHMPTVDGSPQKELWLDTYKRCDKVFTYSEWGKKILEKESGGKIKVDDVISPCADINIFKPVSDKRAHKQSMGIDPNAIIIGTTMRNQKRKLFYDLIEAFSEWCNNPRNQKFASKAFLYLHTSYPDVGYDLGKAIAEFGVGNKVLMTYVCASCGAVYPSFFQGGWTYCKNKACNKPTAHPPNPNSFVSREILSHIYNLFDIYVQYSICEGWGMPVTEAMSCGVPSMCVNYSAMEDHVKMPGGIPINVERFFYESCQETEQRRALPDNNHFADQLTLFFKKNDIERQKISNRTRDYIVEPVETRGCDNKLPRFSWDRAAAIWAYHLRTCDIKNNIETWNNPIPMIHNPKPARLDVSMTDVEFVNWAISYILKEDRLIGSFWAKEWVKALGCGFRFDGPKKVNVDRQYIINIFMEILNNKNYAENFRVGLLRNNKNNKQLEISVL